MNVASRALLIAASMGLAACAAPASVEGVFSGDGFRLDCDTPLAKSNASGRDTVVVLAEYDSETLRTVNIRLPAIADLPIGEELPVDGDRNVDVVVGDLVVETRADGVEVLSAANPVRASSVEGAVVIDERGEGAVAGSFHVDLDDGGYLEGSFVARELE